MIPEKALGRVSLLAQSTYCGTSVRSTPSPTCSLPIVSMTSWRGADTPQTPTGSDLSILHAVFTHPRRLMAPGGCRSEASDCVSVPFYDSAFGSAIDPQSGHTLWQRRSMLELVRHLHATTSVQTDPASKLVQKDSFRDCHSACWRTGSGVRCPENPSLAAVARASDARLGRTVQHRPRGL